MDENNYPFKGYGPEFVVKGMSYVCVRRYRKHKYSTIYNRIKATGPYYFRLLGEDNQIVELVRDDLAYLMKNCKITVKNLNLTSDNRIYTTPEYHSYLQEKSDNLKKFRGQLQYAEENENIDVSKAEKIVNKSEVNNDVYQEEIRKGMTLVVTKVNWSIKYQIRPDVVQDSDSLVYSNGARVEGLNLNEHIAEIKRASETIKSHLKCRGGIDLHITLCEGRYEINYKSEVGKCLFGPSYTTFVVSSEQGLNQWIKDLESCPERVEEIRNRLGWKKHKGLIGKMLGAY